MQKHQRVRTREKPYKCPDCGTGFSQSQHLKTHQQIHKGEKPHLCTECGKSFARADSLMAHQRVHRVDNKPYGCSDRGKAFSSFGKCNAASENSHRRETVPVLSVREKLCFFNRFEKSSEETHWNETILLLRLGEVSQRHLPYNRTRKYTTDKSHDLSVVEVSLYIVKH
ncbi:hypothetical protein J4Q44_G00011020 [Coregonus suidteri]|uniref:C2H2-type domain-containing protein n=1 Tax=Coregonus suidteri TaxID=861788 RepID=A0AAN8MDS2_9TELE